MEKVLIRARRIIDIQYVMVVSATRVNVHLLNFSVSGLSTFNAHTRAQVRAPEREGTFLPMVSGRRTRVACLSCFFFFVSQTTFSKQPLPSLVFLRSQGSLIRPFVLLPNPTLADNSTGMCFGRGNSPITDLMSQFPSQLPHKGMCGLSVPQALLR